MDIRTGSMIAVVGAGSMGAGIAQVAATAGHPVLVLDANQDALARGRSAVSTSLGAAVAKGRMSDSERAAIETRITWSTEMPLVSGAALVIEAIVESLEAKRRLFGGLARVVRVDAVLASNTSSLSISDLAEPLIKRGRFLGLHFFNPVPAMRLVEVVAGSETDPAVVAAAATLMRAWGKHPVQVADVPGFIVNRVARPYYAEGFAALEDGIAPETVDAALVEGGGFRMGPLALADLIGHDVNYAVATSVFEAGFGSPRFRPQPAQRLLVEAGAFGRKSGRGVYDYTQSLPPAQYVEPIGQVTRVTLSDAGPLGPLVDAVAASGVEIVVDPALPADVLDVQGVSIALGDGRPLSDRPDIDVLIDHVRDFATASTFGITARRPLLAQAASAFLDLAGRRAIVVADRPGQLVLRTLAQLANAAADAENDGIASGDDVEAAMMHGANHPEGPLAWMRRVGSARVGAALRNIASSTGDAIYEPSPLISPPAA